MSEQKAWKTFEEAREGLKNVHIKEHLEVQKTKVHEARENLIKVSGKFRQMLLQKEIEATEKAEQRGLLLKLKAQPYISRAKIVKKKAESTRLRIATILKPFGGSIETSLPDNDKEILACPNCYTTNVNWLKVNRKTARRQKLRKGVKEIPWCFRCKKRMVLMAHKEVNKKKREERKARLEMKK